MAAIHTLGEKRGIFQTEWRSFRTREADDSRCHKPHMANTLMHNHMDYANERVQSASTLNMTDERTEQQVFRLLPAPAPSLSQQIGKRPILSLWPLEDGLDFKRPRVL